MAVSEYGREGEKAFKYTELLEDEVHVDNLFGDLVDHWIRYESWDEERDQIYPDEDTLFRGVRDDREIRLKQDDEGMIEVEYGIETQVGHSLDYVESVWQDEMKTILERNSEEDIEDHHILERTYKNIFNDERRAEA
jgi:hypothetical protein